MTEHTETTAQGEPSSRPRPRLTVTGTVFLLVTKPRRVAPSVSELCLCPAPQRQADPRLAQPFVHTLLRCWHWPRPRDTSRRPLRTEWSEFTSRPGRTAAKPQRRCLLHAGEPGPGPGPAPGGRVGLRVGFQAVAQWFGIPELQARRVWRAWDTQGYRRVSRRDRVQSVPCGRSLAGPGTCPLCAAGRVPSPSRPRRQLNPQPGRGQCFPATSLCGQFSKYPVRSRFRVTTGRLLGSGDVWSCTQRLGSVQ